MMTKMEEASLKKASANFINLVNMLPLHTF
jgi:hypothetical protein